MYLVWSTRTCLNINMLSYQSHDQVIVIMEIPIPGKTVFIIKFDPDCLGPQCTHCPLDWSCTWLLLLISPMCLPNDLVGPIPVIWQMLTMGFYVSLNWLIICPVNSMPWWCHQVDTFLRYWLFEGNPPVTGGFSPHKGQWCGALMFSLICAWTKRWGNNRHGGDLRCHCAHYDVIVMSPLWFKPMVTFVNWNIWNKIQWNLIQNRKKLKKYIRNTMHEMLTTLLRPQYVNVLTHWGRATHIWVSKLTIIGSDNDLLPGQRQAIIWTNDGILLIKPIGTNFSEILSKIHTFSFKKMHLKTSSAKWRPFCLMC